MTTAADLKRVRDRERMRVKNVYPVAMDRHHREIAAARAAQRARNENMPFAVARDGAWS